MPSRYMQPLRMLIQYVFFGYMAWLSIDFYRFVEKVRSGVDGVKPTGIEGFLPISGLLGATSWAKNGVLNTIHPAAVVLFLTIVTLSLLLRRAFCSWICPVATLSEFLWKIGFRVTKRKVPVSRMIDVPLRCVKYLLLVLFLWLIVGTMSPSALVDFIQSDYHKIADVRLMNFFLHISPFTSALLLILVVVSTVLRNPFCRYLCPYGALLGLVSLLSPLRVTRHPDRCISCGGCSQACPSHIDVMHAVTVNDPECIGCWRCVSHCRYNSSLTMGVAGRLSISGVFFAILVILIFWGGTETGVFCGHWYSSLTVQDYVYLLNK